MAGPSSHLEGDATFVESERVVTWGEGLAPRAGFVQVMQGQVDDPEEMRRLDEQLEAALPAGRPDVLGSVTLEHDDNRVTSVVSFTSEEEARKGERSALPEDLRPVLERMFEITRERRYYDLTDTWHIPQA